MFVFRKASIITWHESAFILSALVFANSSADTKLLSDSVGGRRDELRDFKFKKIAFVY